MNDDRATLADELVYDRVRKYVNVSAIAVFAGDMACAKQRLGNDPADALAMMATAWDRITRELGDMMATMVHGVIREDEEEDEEEDNHE